jgi:hypothetical protein
MAEGASQPASPNTEQDCKLFSLIEIGDCIRRHWTIILRLFTIDELRFPEKWVLGIGIPVYSIV